VLCNLYKSKEDAQEKALGERMNEMQVTQEGCGEGNNAKVRRGEGRE